MANTVAVRTMNIFLLKPLYGPYFQLVGVDGWLSTEVFDGKIKEGRTVTV